jgi:hypothetical protein
VCSRGLFRFAPRGRVLPADRVRWVSACVTIARSPIPETLTNASGQIHPNHRWTEFLQEMRDIREAMDETPILLRINERSPNRKVKNNSFRVSLMGGKKCIYKSGNCAITRKRLLVFADWLTNITKALVTY